ncbi:MAG: hypothetical protein GXP31_14075 [Kiritimatiellaeota bacterium]|nr:hypothetical protein [Kiritimatiellota bacterium]
MKTSSTEFHGPAAFLMTWCGSMIVLESLVGIHWFDPGDLDWRTAMAYHGVLIPAWMLLVLAYARTIAGLSESRRRWIGLGGIGAAVFAGVGAVLIRREGACPGAMLQVFGMTLGDLTALAVLVFAFRSHFCRNHHPAGRDSLSWWTVSTAMVALSLATPLGHLAGAVRDFGKQVFVFSRHAALLGMAPEDVLDGYIGSHSHQIVAAFLAAAFVLPLLRSSQRQSGIMARIRRVGLIVVVGATVVQAVLYQYCAWLGWEPPNLFAEGPNGMPLDDLILVCLGCGLLLLVPSLWRTDREPKASTCGAPSALPRLTALLLLCFLAVVALGVYIEFHERFFGHAEGAAAGVANDAAYIRGHLLFGFMMIPILLGVLLHADGFLATRCRARLFSIPVLAVAGLGTAGMFLWTFSLNPVLLAVTIFLLLAAGALFGLERCTGPLGNGT